MRLKGRRHIDWGVSPLVFWAVGSGRCRKVRFIKLSGSPSFGRADAGMFSLGGITANADLFTHCRTDEQMYESNIF